MNNPPSKVRDGPVAIVSAQAPPRTRPSIYPDDDLQAALIDGQWRFAHKDGSPY